MIEESLSVPAGEAAEFEEYKRRKRAVELRNKLRGLEPTLLRRNASVSEVKNLCEQARRLSSVCVCVRPIYVKTCRAVLKGSAGVCCFTGGNSESVLKTKLCEVKNALRDGATEIEYSPSAAAIVNGNYAGVRREIKKVLRKAKTATVKINLDADALPSENFLRAAALAVDCGAKILSVRADEATVLSLREKLKKPCSVKVWGVETAADFRSMLSLGCERVGSELAEDIFQELVRE